MKTSLYPVMMSRDIQAERNFFRDVFGFQETFSSDWYISLLSEGFELALIDVNHETIPEGLRKECQGVILNIEVENVDDVYADIKNRQTVKFLMDIRDEAFGQRHFMVESPGHTIVDVIQVIPPSKEFSQNYTEESA